MFTCAMRETSERTGFSSGRSLFGGMMSSRRPYKAPPRRMTSTRELRQRMDPGEFAISQICGSKPTSRKLLQLSRKRSICFL